MININAEKLAEYLAPKYIEEPDKIISLCKELDGSGSLLSLIKETIDNYKKPWAIGDTVYISGVGYGNSMSKGTIIQELNLPGYSFKHYVILPTEMDPLLEIRSEVLGMHRYPTE